MLPVFITINHENTDFSALSCIVILRCLAVMGCAVSLVSFCSWKRWYKSQRKLLPLLVRLDNYVTTAVSHIFSRFWSVEADAVRRALLKGAGLRGNARYLAAEAAWNVVYRCVYHHKI